MKKIILPVLYNGTELQVSAFIDKKSPDTTWFLCLHGLQSNKELFKELLARPYFKHCSVLAIESIANRPPLVTDQRHARPFGARGDLLRP